MGDIGGFLGSMFGAALGPLGSIVGTFAGSEIENANQDKSKITVNRPEQIDYSEALAYASDVNKETSLAQIQAQEFQIRQTDLNRDLQHASEITLGMAKLDTRLQTSKLDYFKQMAAEENRHVEKMTASGDLPMPDFES